MDEDEWFPRRPMLRPGLRVVRRDHAHLQIGIEPDERVVLPDDDDVRALVADLLAGRRPSVAGPGQRRWCDELTMRGLVVDAEHVASALKDAPSAAVAAAFAQTGPQASGRLEARARARIGLDVDDRWRPVVLRLMASAGLQAAGRHDSVSARLVVSGSGELTRRAIDPSMRIAEPHLVLTNVAGRITVGPFVSPGLTACLRCVAAHRCDRDPRHAVIVEQHQPSPADPTPEPCDPVLMHLALAWAVRDLVTFVEGEVPATWSSTVAVKADLGLEREHWTRHPHCGCSWGELLAAG